MWLGALSGHLQYTSLYSNGETTFVLEKSRQDEFGIPWKKISLTKLKFGNVGMSPQSRDSSS